jgi:Na+-transporting methylmalonyl-CoA/oxaloacetate decarboxylase beta subunit
MPSYSGVWTLVQQLQATAAGNWPDATAPIGLFGGGFTTVAVNTIDYINLASAGNAIDFGDLISATIDISKGNSGSSSRGLFSGGELQAGTKINVIQYITFTSIGNATDFGDLTTVSNRGGALSSSTRGINAAGDYNIIDFVTIASAGSATDFGDLAVVKSIGQSGLASTTRGVFCSVADGSSNVIQYITIASAGNATDFGDLIASVQNLGSGSNNTRGIFTGGNPSNVIQYITIASAGNATDFGDLATSSEQNAAVTSATVMAIALCSDGSVNLNTINQITIATTGNATDFGDLTQTRRAIGGGASKVHGGL